jgi:single-strand DNA-binding protein
MYQQITIVCNLGNDPEMRYAPSGDPVTRFSIASGKSWTGQDGQKHDKTVWFRVSVWGKPAEACAQYLAKGRQAMVVGEIEEARVFTDRDGNARASLEVKAREVKFLGQKGDGPAEPATATQAAAVKTPDLKEDIPF